MWLQHGRGQLTSRHSRHSFQAKQLGIAEFLAPIDHGNDKRG
jgi:hypothetical protein